MKKVKLPRKELKRRLHIKLVELQRQMHVLIEDFGGNSSDFWALHDRAEKIRARIYHLSLKK